MNPRRGKAPPFPSRFLTRGEVMEKKEIEVLLVEDDPGDVELTREALGDCRVSVNLRVISSGEEAMRYLRREHPHEGAGRPDMILLDLNMPRKGGREVLQELKEDAGLRSIPVVVLTTSQAESDIRRSYDLGANCYITKPVSFDEFTRVMRSLEDFWFAVVKLPPKT